MRKTISELIRLDGVPVSSRGYCYIKEAVRIMKERHDARFSVTKDLYPSIAKVYGTSPYGVEKAIRYSICKFWNYCCEKIEEDNYFSQIVRSGRRPSNAQFISYLYELVWSEEME